MLKQATVLMRGQEWRSGMTDTRFVPPREPRSSKRDIDAICELSLFVGSLFSSEINK